MKRLLICINKKKILSDRNEDEKYLFFFLNKIFLFSASLASNHVSRNFFILVSERCCLPLFLSLVY